MGGWGSSRWPVGYQRKAWVEDSWFRLSLEGLPPRLWDWGSQLDLVHHSTGVEIGIARAFVVGQGGVLVDREIRLGLPGGRLMVAVAEERVLGGPRLCTRWFLKCPLCDRSACHLYLLEPGGDLGCQRCHRLCHSIHWEPPNLRMARREVREELRQTRDPYPRKRVHLKKQGRGLGVGERSETTRA